MPNDNELINKLRNKEDLKQSDIVSSNSSDNSTKTISEHSTVSSLTFSKNKKKENN